MYQMMFMVLVLIFPKVLLANNSNDYYAQACKQQESEHYAQAIANYQRAIAHNPLHANAWAALGMQYAAHGQRDHARYARAKAIRYDQTNTRAHEQLRLQTAVTNDQNQKKAEQPAQQQEVKHHDANSYKELASTAIAQENYADAMQYLHNAFDYAHPDPMQAFELACLCTQLGMTDRAIEGFELLCKHSPNNKTALYNIGFNHKIAGTMDTAIATFEKLLQLYPDYSNAQFSLARAYIKKGDFHKGWQASIPHYKESGKYAPELRHFLATNTLCGKKILLRPEGHFGDTIQFIRHAQTLKSKGAIIIGCLQEELIPLLSRCDYIDTLIPIGKSTVPTHDASATLMSLPAILDVDETTIEKEIPYIHADPDLIFHWHQKLQSYENTIKIGICWQASVHNDSSRPPIARRGIPLTLLYGLADIPNVTLFCLQKVDGLDELENAPANFIMHQFGDDFDGSQGRFADTAAVMHNLDLVLTVDTAIAHLAGALGARVWVMLPYETDWRWITGRTDSPWYPTMRLFQQPKPFDWKSVAEKVIEEIGKLGKSIA